MDDFFKKHGFRKSDKNEWIVRFGDLLWCNIDKYGFATLRRKSEGNLKTPQRNWSQITLPIPIRTKGSLLALVDVLNV